MNITIDNNTYIYDGDRYNSYELFTYNNKKYFRDTDKYYVSNNTWEVSNNPYKIDKLIDNGNIMTMIESSYLESNTSFFINNKSMISSSK